METAIATTKNVSKIILLILIVFSHEMMDCSDVLLLCIISISYVLHAIDFINVYEFSCKSRKLTNAYMIFRLVLKWK